MSGFHTIGELYENYHGQLELEWIAGRKGVERTLSSNDSGAVEQMASLVGYMNLSHPNRIQVIGVTELDYLSGLGEPGCSEALTQLFAARPAAIIVADGEKAPEQVVKQAEAGDIPLLGSHLPGHRLVNNLEYYLSNMLAEKEVLHGVFIEVMGIGVLLTGDSGIGKSELALELISRGHRLIADDAPEFIRVGPGVITGLCPPLLDGFLEVRGLGVLNIRAMFGDRVIKRNKYLRLVIHLEEINDEAYRTMDRLYGQRIMKTILGEEVPQVTLPVAPGRNLAVLVESAALNQRLIIQGYDAASDFAARSRRHIRKPEQT